MTSHMSPPRFYADEFPNLLFQYECNGRWMVYSLDELLTINAAVKKKQITVFLPCNDSGKKILINLMGMTHKNLPSGLEQKVRCLIYNENNFFYWASKGKRNKWRSYTPYTSFLLEAAFSKKISKLDIYIEGNCEVNFQEFIQVNKDTGNQCKITREIAMVNLSLYSAQFRSILDIRRCTALVRRAGEDISRMYDKNHNEGSVEFDFNRDPPKYVSVHTELAPEIQRAIASGEAKSDPGLLNKYNQPIKIQDNNASYTSLFHARHKIIKELAEKRKHQPDITKLQTTKKPCLKQSGLPCCMTMNYDELLTPIQIATNRAERMAKLKTKSSMAQGVQNGVATQVSAEAMVQVADHPAPQCKIPQQSTCTVTGTANLIPRQAQAAIHSLAQTQQLESEGVQASVATQVSAQVMVEVADQPATNCQTSQQPIITSVASLIPHHTQAVIASLPQAQEQETQSARIVDVDNSIQADSNGEHSVRIVFTLEDGTESEQTLLVTPFCLRTNKWEVQVSDKNQPQMISTCVEEAAFGGLADGNNQTQSARIVDADNSIQADSNGEHSVRMVFTLEDGTEIEQTLPVTSFCLRNNEWELQVSGTNQPPMISTFVEESEFGGLADGNNQGNFMKHSTKHDPQSLVAEKEALRTGEPKGPGEEPVGEEEQYGEEDNDARGASGLPGTVTIAEQGTVHETDDGLQTQSARIVDADNSIQADSNGEHSVRMVFTLEDGTEIEQTLPVTSFCLRNNVWELQVSGTYQPPMISTFVEESEFGGLADGNNQTQSPRIVTADNSIQADSNGEHSVRMVFTLEDGTEIEQFLPVTSFCLRNNVWELQVSGTYQPPMISTFVEESEFGGLADGNNQGNFMKHSTKHDPQSLVAEKEALRTGEPKGPGEEPVGEEEHYEEEDNDARGASGLPGTVTIAEQGTVHETDDGVQEEISRLAILLTDKLSFLVSNYAVLSPLNSLLIQIQTRLLDWQSVSLGSRYFLSRLQEVHNFLQHYELGDVTSDWTCQWDSEIKRYFYINNRTKQTQWTYPEESCENGNSWMPSATDVASTSIASSEISTKRDELQTGSSSSDSVPEGQLHSKSSSSFTVESSKVESQDYSSVMWMSESSLPPPPPQPPEDLFEDMEEECDDSNLPPYCHKS